MSADNWAVCPRCIKRAEAARAEQIRVTGANYGHVPEPDYAEAVQAIRDVNPKDFQTFREDYEIYGASDGKVQVDYSGHCGVCELALDFNDDHPIGGIDE